MKIVNERPLEAGLVIGLVVGLLIGWLGIGWGAWPVKWQDANPALLRDDFRADYVQMTAEMFSRTLNLEQAQNRLREWPDSALYICQQADKASEATGEKQQLLALAQAIAPDQPCDQAPSAEAEPQEEEQSLLSRLGLLCGAILLALLLVGGAFFLIYKRGGRESVEDVMPEGEPSTLVSAGGGRTIPLAQFPTEYNIGHDTYDDSFSIETATGEFMGECGVGISESIGVGDPKKVTAFEVWLFDKNDIRTVTKVIMSEHAYYDDALRAKLAPKGEAVQAKPGETIVLETASLIINARIVEMEYGAGALPPQSFFNRLVVELAAWAKETPESAQEPPLDDADPNEFAL